MGKYSRRGRVDWVDIAKGIGILLVVYGHAMGPGMKYVYLFHLPLFMMLSGYVYNPDQSFGTWLWKKFTSIYIPFAGWNFIVIMIRIAYAIDQGVWENVAEGRLNILWTMFLCINKEDQYLGATWYLGTLFLVSIIYKLIDMIVPKFKYRQVLILGFFGGWAVYAFMNTLPYTQSRSVILAFFYAFGRYLHLHEKDLERFKGLSLALLLYGACWSFGQFTNASMATNEYGNIPLFILCAFLGSFSMITLARWLADRKRPFWEIFAAPLRLLGKNTMDILIWHFVAFRFVVIYQLVQEGLPWYEVFNVDSRYNTTGSWWAVYLAAGIVIPLLWGWFLRHGPLGWLLKKICLVRGSNTP